MVVRGYIAPQGKERGTDSGYNRLVDFRGRVEAGQNTTKTGTVRSVLSCVLSTYLRNTELLTCTREPG